MQYSWDTASLWHPLAEDGSNAFNPRFLIQWLEIATSLFSVVAGWDLVHLGFRRLHGSLAVKNVGFGLYIRLFLILIIAVVWWQPWWVMSMVICAVMMPLHLIEPLVSPIPRDVLMLWWPLLLLFEVALTFQQSTQWPAWTQWDSSLSGVAIACTASISWLEYYWWCPGSQLTFDYASDESLRSLLSYPNLFDRLTFCWMNPMISESYRTQQLAKTELPQYSPAVLNSRETGQVFAKHYKPGHSDWTLVVVLMKAFGMTALVSFIWELFSSLLDFVEPQLLRLLIGYFEGGRPILYGVLICGAMFVSTFVETLVFNNYFLSNLQFGLEVRSSLTAALYNKSLRVSRHATQSPSDVINLMSVDINRIQSFITDMSTLIIAPTNLVLAVASLWPLVGGRATLASVVTMILVVPINSAVVKKTRDLQKTQMKIKDKRTKLTSDILSSIRSIKLFAWEQPMADELDEVRTNEELRIMYHIRTLWQIVAFIWRLIPFLVSFVAFGVYSWEGHDLTPEVVFPSLALLNLLSSPLFQLPGVLNSAVETGVSLQRINQFLSLPDDENYDITGSNAAGGNSETAVFANGTFSWDDEKPVLKDIRFSVNRGQLHCVVGRVGQGKSSLLSAILGHLNMSKGSKVKVSGTIAYCAQSPWIMNATVKENILFGHRYDAEYYQTVVKACQLEPDMAMLTEGDRTLVGEKGVQLSGGQKARLAIARAVYSCSDVYLLDDVLSAVDSHVGRRLIQEVILGLLKNRTVVLATNSISVLHEADVISMVDDGELVESFERGQSPDNSPKITRLITEFGGEQRESSPCDIEEPVAPLSLSRRASVETFRWDPLAKLSATTDVNAEKSAQGKVKWKVFSSYAKACGISGVVAWILLSFVSQGLSVASNYWLKHWTEQIQGHVGYFLGGYALLGFSSVLLATFVQLFAFLVLFRSASTKIHRGMVKGVLGSPMRFFDANPLGRILNRFTSDVSKVDVTFPSSISAFLRSVISTSFILGVIGYVIPLYIVAMVLLSLLYVYYETRYVSSSRELKRLVSVSRSPIYAHLGESLNGRDTIAAYGQMPRFVFINHANVDFNIKAVYMLRSINRWLYFRLQMIGSVGVLGATGLAVLSTVTAHPISPAMAGFLMTYAFQVMSSLKMVVRLSAEVETNGVAIERCWEYANLPPEEKEGASVPRLTWPENGAITFDNYSTQYRSGLGMVLKNINAHIKPGEKIGVVGRTGAGKSSLTLALFRMIEAVDGGIDIDSLTIAGTTLFDLRHRLSIIPQDSQLVGGSVRYNLDPFSYYTDEEIWDALSLAHLKPVVESLEGGLLGEVKEGATNFSHGQRQLISLARVILKLKDNNSKILVLDEATASVDVETDKIIQQTIRQQFSSKTIITIAHRLDTVMDSDKIMTLDNGELKEFDSPSNLLERGGIFAELCQQGGYTDKSTSATPQVEEIK